jgi:hypothetical protein
LGGIVVGGVVAHALAGHEVGLPHIPQLIRFAKKKSRGGPGQAPTGPRRPARYRRQEGPRSGGREPYRKRPPGYTGPWPPKN